MAANAAARTTRPGGLAVLWFGVLGGAAAWTARLVGSYMLVALACDLGLIGPQVMGITLVEALVLALTLAMAGVSAVATYVSWRIWRRTRAGAWDQTGGPAGRSGFLAMMGIVLGTKYIPSTAHAYDSLQFITNEVFLGRFIRGIHYFGASAVVVLVLLHTIRVFLTGSYKFPREMTWITGVGLLIVTFFLAFTGQVLRWDQNSVWSLVVSAHFAAQVPLIGDWLAGFILAGTTVTGATLSRVFAFHVFFLPAFLIALIGLHLYLVLRNGISEPPRAGRPVDPERYRAWYERVLRRRGRPYWPDAGWLEFVFALGVVFLVAVLAFVLGPRELAEPPDPTIVTTDPRPDWYFTWYYALLALYPPGWAAIVMVYIPLAVVLLMLVLPILANKGERSPTRRPWAVGVVAGTVISLSALTFIGAQPDWVPDFQVQPLPEEVTGDELEVRQGALVLHARGCLYCHTVAGYGGSYGPDLTHVRDRLSPELIRVRILRGIGNMPAYADILPAEAVDALLVFFEHLHSR